MKLQQRVGLLALLAGLGAAAGVVGAQEAQAGPEALPARVDRTELQAGAEFGLPWPPVARDLPIYVPADYRPERGWPVVLLYHGMGGEPTTELIRQASGGKGVVVVGMAYTEPGLVRRTPEQERTYQLNELAQLERLIEALPRHVHIDRDRVFLAGISKGGWQVSAFAQCGRPKVAGYAILLGGRRPRPHGDRPDLADRFVYVGTGENDEANIYARMAAQFFERCGARVTWEEYANKGHEVDAGAARLKAWVSMVVVGEGAERREQAQEWVDRRLAKARDSAGGKAAYRILADTADDPRSRFCGDTLRARLESLLEQASLSSEVQPEIQARRVFERALWREQTAGELRDVEEALALYKQAAKRYPKTVSGGLADREVVRLQRLVDDGRQRARDRAPKVPKTKIVVIPGKDGKKTSVVSGPQLDGRVGPAPGGP